MSSLHTDVILYIYLFIFVFQESKDKRRAIKERLTRATGNARRIGVARLWRSLVSLRASLRSPEKREKVTPIMQGTLC